MADKYYGLGLQQYIPFDVFFEYVAKETNGLDPMQIAPIIIRDDKERAKFLNDYNMLKTLEQNISWSDAAAFQPGLAPFADIGSKLGIGRESTLMRNKLVSMYTDALKNLGYTEDKILYVQPEARVDEAIVNSGGDPAKLIELLRQSLSERGMGMNLVPWGLWG